jgi:pimeloyl-ACP methyl ester carboxylesterase
MRTIFWKLIIGLFLVSPVSIALAEVEVSIGTIEGAHFTVAKPENWQGKLLMIAHGHRFESQKLDGGLNIKGKLYSSLLSEGWMLATSSYRRNGIIVNDAILDLESLRRQINESIGAPEQIFVIGNSMGGAIATHMAETLSEHYDGVVAIGAALRARDDRIARSFNYDPLIPIIFLTNQSELRGPEAYVAQAANATVAPVLWQVNRDGHVNVNDAEREAAIRALVAWVESGEVDRDKDGTISGDFQHSSAELTSDGARSHITGISQNFGNIFAGFIESDLVETRFSQGSHFRLIVGEKTIQVFWGINYRDVGPGEWVAFISAEGNLMFAINGGNACEAIDCAIGDALLLQRW